MTTRTMTLEEARKWLEKMIDLCGMGFHPDTPVTDYVKPIRGAKKLEVERGLAHEAFESAGKDIYAEGLAICERRGLLAGH